MFKPLYLELNPKHSKFQNESDFKGLENVYNFSMHDNDGDGTQVLPLPLLPNEPPFFVPYVLALIIIITLEWTR